MKKLLVLALVMGMASFAAAAWSFAPNQIGAAGTTTIMGDYLGADLLYAIVSKAPITVAFGAGAPGVADGASAMIVDDAVAGGVTGIADGFNGGVYAIASFSTIPNRVDVAMFEISGALPNSEVILYLVDGGSMAAQEVARTIVPEPMTMVLLGLGGLFLRKRG